MSEDIKNLSKNQVHYFWKKIDRKMKLATSDTEVAGIPNEKLLSSAELPLTLTSIDDKINALGGLTAREIISQLDKDRVNLNDRKVRYDRLKNALNYPEITGIVNIYADESTTEDKDGEMIHIIHPNNEIVEVIEDLFLRIGLYDRAWEIIREMCSYGDMFCEVVISRDLTQVLKLVVIPREFIKRNEKNGELIGFELLEEEILNQNNPYFMFNMNIKDKEDEEKKNIHPFRILHFKIPSSRYGVYGEAVIDCVIDSIEMLSIMERALLIARVTRAPERRIFTVDVGTLQGDAAVKYTEQVMNRFRNKRRLDIFTKQKLDYHKDIFGVTEDLAIPKRAGAEGNSIDTLPQLNDPNTEDLNWVRDKIFPGVGIPRQYLFDESFANSNLNLSSKSVPFAKRIRRIQRYFLYQIYKLAYIELKLKGYSKRDIEELNILMNNPSNIDEKERLEIETNRWNLITQMKGLNAESIFIPDYVIYKDILKLNDDEIVEWLKLGQLQSAGKNIFLAKPEDERPEGSEELIETPPPTEGAEEEEGAPTPTTTPGGEEGGTETAPEEETIPPETINALGPPPAEVAEYIDKSLTKVKPYSEALIKKKRFLESINNNVFIVPTIEQETQKRVIKPKISLEELEIKKEFNGLDDFIKKTIIQIID